MFLVLSCSCLCPIQWSQMLSWEWRCSWSSADRRCSNYIWAINNFIAYQGAAYIRGFTIYIYIYRLRWWDHYKSWVESSGNCFCVLVTTVCLCLSIYQVSVAQSESCLVCILTANYTRVWQFNHYSIIWAPHCVLNHRKLSCVFNSPFRELAARGTSTNQIAASWMLQATWLATVASRHLVWQTLLISL